MIRYIFLLFLSIIFTSSSLRAFQQPLDYGEIPKEQLEKKIYAIDSTANAVILFDKGESYVDTDLKVRFKRHVRIKVLTDRGLEEGNVNIGFRTEDPEQDVREVKATAYSLSPGGKVKSSDLGKRERFIEAVSDDWSELRFSVPGLQVGSVFEYSYEIVTESPLYMKSWQFQKEIPVLWTEYRVRTPQWFNYLTLVRSFYPLEETSQSTFRGKARLRFSSTQAPSGMGGTIQSRTERSTLVSYDGLEYKWAMKDVPALTDEPYLNSVEDYSAKVILQLNSLQFPRSQTEPILTNWYDFIKIVEEGDFFGDHIRSGSTLKNIVGNTTNSDQTKFENMIALYDHVREKMNWNGDYELELKKDVDKVYEDRTGNGSEVNMVLVQLLREAGIDADPVILSTRKHGQILDVFPIVEQFNHAVAYAEIDSTNYLLDATLKDKPFDLLPIDSQNGAGLIIDQEKAGWVPLINKTRAEETSLVTVKVNENGSLSGKVESKSQGYYAFSRYQRLKEGDRKEKLHNDLFSGDEIFTIDSVSVDQAYSWKEPFNYTVEFSSRGHANSRPDVMYINPFIVGKVSENPFKRKERNYPVDFNFPVIEKVVTRIRIPDGWELDEAPESKVVRLPGKLGEFKRIIQPSGNLILMVYSFEMNAYKIQPDQYPYLQEMFQQLVNSMRENIVIKKS